MNSSVSRAAYPLSKTSFANCPAGCVRNRLCPGHGCRTRAKEIFATRIRRLPIIKWLLAILHAAENHQLASKLVQAALELEFLPEQVERQRDTAVRWGRYTEIMAYEDNTERISPEPAEASALTAPSDQIKRHPEPQVPT